MIKHNFNLADDLLNFTNFDLQNIVTPVNVNNFEQLLLETGYDSSKTKYLIKGFKNGFSLKYKGKI